MNNPSEQARWAVVCLAFFFLPRRSEIVAIRGRSFKWFALRAPDIVIVDAAGQPTQNPDAFDRHQDKPRDPARVDTPEGTRLYLIELLKAVDKKLTRIDERPSALRKAAINNEIAQEKESFPMPKEREFQAPPEPPEQAASTHPPLKKRKRRSNN
ncbi:hypothetical protein GQ600_16458 [Phytophthora cactorum]|nr:hypothetical protein GQ600_16458 [Phytophthora cactorum]